jgi:uncharacterized protein YjbJ (UPF0337 family)
MPDKDELVGRAKEAMGDLTDDDKLKQEGQADQAAGKVKGKIDDLADKAKDVIDKR